MSVSRRATSPRAKSARRSERPFQSCTRWSLHLRITLLGRIIPRAASLVATSLVGCLRRVLSESGASAGECKGQRERRSERFHGVSPYVCVRGGVERTLANRERFLESLCPREIISRCAALLDRQCTQSLRT